MRKSQLTYQNLIDFSIALDSHVLISEYFFDADFLTLIEQYLGYTNCSFTIYESNRTYVGSLGHNVPMEKDYEDDFLNRDPLAKYITANFDELISRENKIIKSSEIFNDYMNCEFHEVLRSFSEIDFAAVIPFDNFRLTVYKSTIDGDFSEEELNLLNTLEKIISSRYALFAKVIKPTYERSLEELKNLYFDTISTGVIILDSNYTLLDCNKIGCEYINTLAPDLPIPVYFRNLLPLLNFSPLAGNVGNIERVVKFDNFIINIKLYDHKSTLSYDDSVFFITITYSDPFSHTEQESSKDTAQLHAAFRERYTLSQREMDIIFALSNGQKYQQIADSLFISINTVRTHVKNIYRKLNINNQRSLLYLYNQFFYSDND